MKRTCVVALLLLLAACDTATPSGSPGSASPASASPASSPGEPVEVAAWGVAGDRVDFDDQLGFSQIHDMQPFGDGYISVGGDALGAATWHSDDGLGWTKSPVDPDLAGGVMQGVIPFGGGLVGWGAMLPLPWELKAAVWVSADGRDWRRAEGLPEDATLQRIGASPAGFLAFLVRDDGRGMLVMTSPNGSEWSMAPGVVARDSTLQAIDSGPDGFSAVFASDRGIAIWLSETGLDWRERGTISGPAVGRAVTSLASTDATIVAVGYVTSEDAESSAVAWSSRDGGRTWTMGTIDPVQPTFMHRVERFEGGFLALGIVSGGLSDAQPVAWASADGRTWSRLGLGPQDSQLFGLRQLDGTFFAWGIEREGQARVWASPAPSPAFSDAPHAGIACPVATPTFRDVVLIPKEGRLACIGGARVSGLAHLVPREGAGGVCPTIEPTWLSCGATVYFAADAGPSVHGLPVVFDPSTTFDPASLGWFALTGQLDHPAAQTCHSTVPVDEAEAAHIIAECRATFVVTSIEFVSAP